VDCRAGLDGYSGHQKQQDAQQRRVWIVIVALRMILHNSTKMKRVSFAPASCAPIVVADMKAAA
jgi:hypothetical protein